MKKLIALAVLLAASAAHAWDGPPQLPGVGTSNLLAPRSYVDADFMGFTGPQPYDSSYLMTNLVLYHDDRDTIQGGFKLKNFHFEETLPLTFGDGTPGSAPTNLWGANVNFAYSHREGPTPESADWGVLLSFGSESDVLFNSIHEMDLSLTGTYRLPSDLLHGWVFFLNIATNRPFLPGVPIPGAGYYSISPANHTQLFLGIPFFVGWQPATRWNLTFTYFIPTSIHAAGEYALNSDLKLHADVDSLPQAWLRAGRADYTDRLIFVNVRAYAGLKASLSEPLFLNFYGGYAFDQEIYEAESQFSANRIVTKMPAGAFINAEIAAHL